MNSTTADSKALLLANLATSWSEEILMLCIIVPIGAIGIVLNLMSLRIFLKKSIRSTSLFKYLIILSLVNSIIALCLIFSFVRTPYIFYDLALSIFGRIYYPVILNNIILYFFFFGNLIEIMINIERALYFSEGFEKLKKHLLF